MAQRKVKSPAVAEGKEGSGASAADKIASLLAVIATRDMDTETAALKLDAIGFSAREISALLDVGPNYVHAARHRRKGGTKSPRKKA